MIAHMTAIDIDGGRNQWTRKSAKPFLDGIAHDQRG